jgi:hypothetical protein
MNLPNDMNLSSQTAAEVGDADAALRLIASLPVPDGLEDRVHAALRRAPRTASVLPWPAAKEPGRGWVHGTLARTAAAAAIVFVVAGGGWGVYTRVQPTSAPKVIAMPRVASPGGFSSANAMRTPQTLEGPKLPHETAKPAIVSKTPARTAKKPIPLSKPSARNKAIP